MSEQSRFPRSILGRMFPEGFVAALMESSTEAIRALDALSHTRLAREDVIIMPGQRALEIDASHHPSLELGPPLRGEEAVTSQEFLAGALLGDVLIGIRAGSEVTALAVTEVLTAEGARPVHAFGPAGQAHELTKVSA